MLIRNRGLVGEMRGKGREILTGKKLGYLSGVCYIWRTSLPFISGRSTSHSSRRTAKRVSAKMSTRPRLQTRVMA